MSDTKDKNTFLKEVLEAVRADKEVGRGTLSMVEETMKDDELLKVLEEMYDDMTSRWKYVVKAYINKVKDLEAAFKEREEEIKSETF